MRSPHRSPNRPAKRVQLAGSKSIALAQAKQTQDPIDWQNNFNLALYYLVAGRFEESDGLYDSRSGRLCQRASEASMDSIKDAIKDLDDYLMLFPDRIQAWEVRDALRASKAERLSASV